jgi:deazaflavin-dependent oxidoreductase (nitroreductase family)
VAKIVTAERRVKEYKPGRWRRVENAVMSALARAGLVPSSYLLTTKGRKSGQPRSNPVTIVEYAGRRWLVAPYGSVSWVHNARAAGQVSLNRRLHTRHYSIREASAVEAGPVLQRYVAVATATQEYFEATTDAPIEQFVADCRGQPASGLRTRTDRVRPNFIAAHT